MKTRGFIIDIDGTVALHTESERAHFDYSKVINDRPNHPIIYLAEMLYGSGLDPVFMSGRADENNGQVRLDTESWLFANIDFYEAGHPLYMRPEFLEDRPDKRDFRPDFEVKRELYYRYVAPNYDIVYAIDDRPQVLKMWHSIGITTLAVGTPWIEF